MSGPTAVSIELPEVTPTGDLVVPDGAYGVVLFAHGSGSSRHSPRNRAVAGQLQERGLATLLADLLTPAEERRDAQTGALRFDIGMLGDRLTRLVDWAATAGLAGGAPTGLFGASTGAAAALVAAAARPWQVRAVVSRGGRPDLAGAALAQVRAPTLLIVGDRDPQVLVLNQQAAARVAGRCRIHVVAGATHLFEEPGALAEVADRAASWFEAHLRGPDAGPVAGRLSG
jgi:dienelactone hydrolase